MSEELKPCPFCGGVKIRVNTKRSVDGRFGDGCPGYYVTAYATCGQCHARGAVVSKSRVKSWPHNEYLKTLEEIGASAKAAWNARK